jgi:hypothetical protein
VYSSSHHHSTKVSPWGSSKTESQQQKEVYIDKVHIWKAASILQISELVPELFLPESEAALSPKSDKTQQHIKTPQSEELEREAESDRVNGKLGLGGRRGSGWGAGSKQETKKTYGIQRGKKLTQ